MYKQRISNLIRILGLAWLGDYARFTILKSLHKKRNLAFKSKHPEFAFPPDYLIYESFQMDLEKYYKVGKADAQWIIDEISPYIKLQHKRILDWGCGPGRMIRHFPTILDSSNEYFGTDYNKSTIDWCTKNINGVQFSLNGINPPLTFPADFFDLVYGISIFTHLSLANHQPWSDELFRISKKGGILLITTHGKAFLEKLTTAEQAEFNNGNLVSRINVKEGHRMFGAFHPPEFMSGIFTNSGFTILSHRPGKKMREDYIEQDVWILKK